MFELTWPFKKVSATIAILALGSICLAGCSGSDGSVRATPAPSGQVITVVAVENGLRYLYEPGTLKARPGEITLRFQNQSTNQVPHRLDVKTKDGSGFIASSGLVPPGDFTQFKFTITEEGTYEFLCLVLGHSERGQSGTLTIAR